MHAGRRQRSDLVRKSAAEAAGKGRNGTEGRAGWDDHGSLFFPVRAGFAPIHRACPRGCGAGSQGESCRERGRGAGGNRCTGLPPLLRGPTLCRSPPPPAPSPRPPQLPRGSVTALGRAGPTSPRTGLGAAPRPRTPRAFGVVERAGRRGERAGAAHPSRRYIKRSGF